MPYPSLLHPEPLPLWQFTADPYLHRRHSNTVPSLRGVSGSWCTQGSICTLQESISSVLCKFWQLCGGVNGDLLQEGICHTQVCCPQSPSLLHCPLLACTSTGDTQTQFCLSLCGVPGSWCMQDLFEPSEYFWRVRDSILNAISSLLPSCWGFSFARGPEVSPQSHSSTTQLPLGMT